ncbi:N-6 DNA methylase [Methylobacterium gregans]|uniref:site-specific DNA-methyltransferase (adenine-specific) n=1 Tax=Methylobacterium gregans TaxID=374424 RepID=A0AA37HP16_9HYPH|nr:N-6 DNA methylase [Methylobacterium gregans]MDQ0518845.1 type I restriction-modification system DNA methylase subunit [Methylobacterium gregans]GJD79044.1 hypothetical protein NBEOAGPD_2264 [Methylobacterium gregans]GLS57248.1 hypothetical protein GCM10007886_54340 [Methylobacterium gregans]
MSVSAYHDALARTGYLRKSELTWEPVKGLVTGYNAESLQLEPAFSDRAGLAVDAVYETVDGPMLLIKDAGSTMPTQETLDQWVERAWNLGIAPLLWIVTPTDVRVYDSFRGIGPQSAKGPVGTFALAIEEQMRQLDEACGRLSLDTGAFWRSSLAENIDRSQRIDKVLLREIAELERQLVLAGPKHDDDADAQKRERDLCQELVLCTLFASYLLARGIAQPLLPDNLPADLSRIYEDTTQARHLFDWLHETFNGDVFPRNVGQDARLEHLVLLRDFVQDISLLKGQRGQFRLFKFRFDTIPIELISSVYEEFAQRTAGALSRQQSLHYTPVELVHMALDPVFDGLDARARVLDPTCGSGLFLVQALRRLVWKRCGNGPRPRRIVREILYKQVFGVDVNRAALRIAAFSLYLAALEIETTESGELYDRTQFERLIGKTLFCDSFLEKTMQDRCRKLGVKAIVGNVPWTYVRGNTSTATANAKPRRSPDHAFLSAAIDVVGADGRLAIYVKATPFFSRDASAIASRNSVIQRLNRLALINLSNLRSEDLFPGVRGPALLVCANCGHLPDQDYLLAGRLPWTGDFKRSGRITLTSADFKTVPKAAVLAAPSYLKAIMLGTARDALLMQRIEAHDLTLGSLLERIGIYDWSFKKHAGPLKSQIITRCGQGFQVKGENVKPVSDTIANLPAVFAEDYRAVQFDPTTIRSLEKRGITRVLFERARSIYDAPLLLCPKSAHQLALKKGRYSAAIVNVDAAYSESFYGISFKNRDVRLAQILCAILNSAVAGFQFLFGAGGVGIERPAVEPNDLRQLRLPEFDVTDELARRAQDALDQSEHDGGEALDTLADELYKLNPSEGALVRDSIGRARSSFLDTPEARQEDVRAPDYDELTAYASATCQTVNAILRVDGSEHLMASIAQPLRSDHDPTAAFSVVRFAMASGRAKREVVVKAMAAVEAQAVYDSVRHSLVKETYTYLRERRAMRIYGERDVTIVKPAQRRYWSVAAGFEDGDIILTDHWTQAGS